jgi:cyclophilin family peptidyl-prolyl cis-trans isomerase
MKAFLLALTFCLCAPLTAQGKTPPRKAPKPAPAAEPAPAAPAPVPAKATPKPRVELVTSYGPMVVELEPDLAPGTVDNFLRYVAEGFYTDTTFHRVIEGFMVQGGGLTADLTEKPTARGPILNEAPATFKAGLRNTRGTIAMARQDKPQSATAQFYINTADNATLDHKDQTDAGYGYCAFGRVVSGMEVVDKIEKVRTVWRRGMQNVPEYPVRIKSAQRLPDQP